MTAESWVGTLWQGGHGVVGSLTRTALLPTELIFRSGVAVRSALWNSGLLTPGRAPVPVIGVGNLSVGGTGKTPFASWVIRALLEAGAKPALVARGYGADELELHRNWTPRAAVVADRDRVAAAREAAAGGASMVVLDDGFQHRRLARDLDIVLLAAEQGPRTPMLPRGPFREPLSALSRADVVVITRKSAGEATAAEVAAAARPHAGDALFCQVSFEPSGLRRLGDAAGTRDTHDPVAPPARARVLTAVARPDEVVRSAERLGIEVVGLSAFPDHHEFTAADLARSLRGWEGAVIVTAKDAVKLKRLELPAGAEVLVLEQAMTFEAGEAELRAAVLKAAAGAVSA